MDGLPAHYRQVFELCVRQGMAYQEAGKQLGLPTGTVAIRIMRARNKSSRPCSTTSAACAGRGLLPGLTAFQV